MKIELTNIWKINNVLVVADSIDEAILTYRAKKGNITIHRIELITDIDTGSALINSTE